MSHLDPHWNLSIYVKNMLLAISSLALDIAQITIGWTMDTMMVKMLMV